MAKIAIIETGGKQYVVTEGAVLTVEKLSERPSSAKASEGHSKISFDKVLLTDDGSKVTLGTPYISGSKVTAEVVDEGKNDKVTVIRYRQKSRYFKKKGHRQPYAKIKITALP